MRNLHSQTYTHSTHAFVRKVARRRQPNFFSILLAASSQEFCVHEKKKMHLPNVYLNLHISFFFFFSSSGRSSNLHYLLHHFISRGPHFIFGVGCARESSIPLFRYTQFSVQTLAANRQFRERKKKKKKIKCVETKNS